MLCQLSYVPGSRRGQRAQQRLRPVATQAFGVVASRQRSASLLAERWRWTRIKAIIPTINNVMIFFTMVRLLGWCFDGSDVQWA